MAHIPAAIALVAGMLTATACTYLPQLNTERRIEVGDLKQVVECEVVSAVRTLGPKVFTVGKWDVKSTLDLTLVESIDADGRLTWVIPVGNTLTPNGSIGHRRTSTAHVEFITPIRAAMRRHLDTCGPQHDPSDPSGTGLGLAAWIQTTFRAIGTEEHAGLSYTRIFELSLGGGARFGFIFANVPVTGDVGSSVNAIRTNQLVVSVSPHVDSGPTEVVIVGDKRETGRGAPASRRQQIITNPIGNQMLRQQAPVRLLPGTTLPTR